MDGGVMMMNHGEAAVSSIELVDGTLFDPLQPDPDLMSLEVIAHALANNGRFAGQVRNFYSDRAALGARGRAHASGHGFAAVCPAA